MTLWNDPVIGLSGALGLAMLFALTGVHKLKDGDAFTRVLSGYAVLPTPLVPVMARLLAVAELGTAFALTLPASRPGATLFATMLLMAYAGVMSLVLWRGREISDCGCSVGANRQAVRWPLVWRNLALATLGLVCALGAPTRELILIDLLTIFMSTLAGVALYALTNTLISNHYRQQEIFHG